MEEIVSLVVANGLWAVLFCALLCYELRDSRRREARYTGTIKALSDRLGAVNSVKADTAEIITDVGVIKSDTKRIRSDTDAIKKTVAAERKGAVCASNASA